MYLMYHIYGTWYIGILKILYNQYLSTLTLIPHTLHTYIIQVDYQGHIIESYFMKKLYIPLLAVIIIITTPTRNESPLGI
jgi:hypothetical protein